MVWDLIADRLIPVIGLICCFVLTLSTKIISYPQHMNTIAFTIQWAGCPKGCSRLSILTMANMTMLRQDLFLKNKINFKKTTTKIIKKQTNKQRTNNYKKRCTQTQQAAGSYCSFSSSSWLRQSTCSTAYSTPKHLA